MNGSGWYRESRRHSLASRGIRTGRKFDVSYFKNLQMNPDTYKLRRQVMDFVYEAKRLDPNMPRVEVRITDDHHEVLGCASTRGRSHIIWISTKALQKQTPRQVVFHEILHTIYGVPHDSKSPLMGERYRDLDKESCDKEFLRLISKSRCNIGG